jgi:hypothetical protein
MVQDDPIVPILQTSQAKSRTTNEAAEIGCEGRLACRAYQALFFATAFQKSLGELKCVPPAMWRWSVCMVPHMCDVQYLSKPEGGT